MSYNVQAWKPAQPFMSNKREPDNNRQHYAGQTAKRVKV